MQLGSPTQVGGAVDGRAAQVIRPAEVPNEISLMGENLDKMEQAIKELIDKLECVSYREATTVATEKLASAEPAIPDPRCEISARLNAHNSRLHECTKDITYIRKHLEL